MRNVTVPLPPPPPPLSSLRRLQRSNAVESIGLTQCCFEKCIRHFVVRANPQYDARTNMEHLLTSFEDELFDLSDTVNDWTHCNPEHKYYVFQNQFEYFKDTAKKIIFQKYKQCLKV